MAWLERFTWLLNDRERHLEIIIVGSRNAGKRTFAYQLKPSEIRMKERKFEGEGTIRRFSFRKLVFTAFGLSIQNFEQHRSSVLDADVLIYVIDATDCAHLETDKDILHRVIARTARETVPIVIVCNKMDCVGARSSIQIREELNLSLLNKRNPCLAVECSSLTGDGFNAVFDWLGSMLRYPS